jgi:hypothetical protein
MMNRRNLGVDRVANTTILATESVARAVRRLRAQNIVLVHGLFADGSSDSTLGAGHVPIMFSCEQSTEMTTGPSV